MKVAIVSDTHWRRPDQARERLFDLLSEADQILHAGDVEAPFVLERLAELAPLHAVRGNCDRDHLELPDSLVVELDGLEVGLFHGHQVNLYEPAEVTGYFGDAFPLVVHGHVHVPRLERHGECTIFCPGSPFEPRNGTPGCIGWLEIEGGAVKSLTHQRISWRGGR